MSKFLRVSVIGKKTEKVVINTDQITYFDPFANEIRLSDGLVLHITDVSMTHLLETIGI